MTTVSVEVVVDRVAPVGLSFFALQVNFDNDTWAHGGLQDIDSGGRRSRWINWGGLVDRGGGSADYAQENDRADLERIQDPPAEQHLGAYGWKEGVAYELTVTRGAQVTLAPGDYQLLPDRPTVSLDHPRTMYEWRFSVRPAAGNGPGFDSLLYDQADAIDAFMVWNEAGYGSTADQQHARWSAPRYVVGDDGSAATPTSWARF